MNTTNDRNGNEIKAGNRVMVCDGEYRNAQGEVLRTSGELAEVDVEFVGNDGQYHQSARMYQSSQLIVVKM